MIALVFLFNDCFFQIKIKLPDTEYKDVELDVTDMFLSCRTPN